MDKKFELLHDDFLEFDDCALFRIRSLRSFGDVKKGQIGGFVESEENLSHDGNAWIGGDAQVSGNARVEGHAQVKDSALISDDARVYDYARVDGKAQVCDKAQVHDYARVGGNAQVCNEAHVYGKAQISGNARLSDWRGSGPSVYGNAHVFGDALVSDIARIRDKAQVFGNASVEGLAEVCGDAQVFGQAEVCRHAKLFEDISDWGDARIRNSAIVGGCADIKRAEDIQMFFCAFLADRYLTVFRKKDGDIELTNKNFRGAIGEFREAYEQFLSDNPSSQRSFELLLEQIKVCFEIKG